MDTATAPNKANLLLQQSEQFAQMSEEMYHCSYHFLRAYEILMAMLNVPRTTSTTPSEFQVPMPGATPVPVSQEPAEIGAALVTPEEADTASAADKPIVLSPQEVRHRITLAAREGYAEPIKALLNRYGANKVSDVDPAQYQSLLADLNNLMKSEVGADD